MTDFARTSVPSLTMTVAGDRIGRRTAERDRLRRLERERIRAGDGAVKNQSARCRPATARRSRYADGVVERRRSRAVVRDVVKRERVAVHAVVGQALGT